MKKKEKYMGLSDDDKIMFADFIEWFNLNKSKGTFCFEDPEFQSFKKNNGIELDNESPIPNAIKKPNTIIYKKNKSKVGDLARHIKNAYSHSTIQKENGYFIMSDFDYYKTKEITMRGKITVELMQDLLDAIRNNKRNRKKSRISN